VPGQSSGRETVLSRDKVPAGANAWIGPARTGACARPQTGLRRRSRRFNREGKSLTALEHEGSLLGMAGRPVLGLMSLPGRGCVANFHVSPMADLWARHVVVACNRRDCERRASSDADGAAPRSYAG
jgi:hypothetical protein